jgi:hypothetical protein
VVGEVGGGERRFEPWRVVVADDVRATGRCEGVGLLKERVAETGVGGVFNGEYDEEAPPCDVTSFGVHLGKVECVVVFVGVLADAAEDVFDDPLEVLWCVTRVACHEEGV